MDIPGPGKAPVGDRRKLGVKGGGDKRAPPPRGDTDDPVYCDLAAEAAASDNSWDMLGEVGDFAMPVVKLAMLGLVKPDSIGLLRPAAAKIDKGVCGLGGKSCRGLERAPGGSPRAAKGGNTNLGLLLEALLFNGKVCNRLILELPPLLRGQERSRVTGRGIDKV